MKGRPANDHFENIEAVLAHAWAGRIGMSVGLTSERHDPAAWRRELVEARGALVGGLDEPRNPRERTEAQAKLQQIDAAVEAFNQVLIEIERAPQDEQRHTLELMFRNFVIPRAHAEIGNVPFSALPTPDWKAVTGELRRTSSEPSALKLTEALERGKFRRNEASDYPMADITGRLGGTSVTAHAELTPNADDGAQGDGAAIVATIARRLEDPKVGHGIRTAQAYEALMSAWLQRRSTDGNCTITLPELTRNMGFAWDEQRRSFDRDAYAAVREAVAVLARLTLRAFGLPALKGMSLPSRLEEPAFTITLIGPDNDDGQRIAETWGAIVFRPNVYLKAAVTQPGAYIMGTDQSLNRLNPRRERAEVLMGRWLERQWRLNLAAEHCSVTRRVLLILTDGIGLTEENAQRPRAETLDRMVTALEALEEQTGTIKHWAGDEAYQAAMADVDKLRAAGRYVTRSVWQRLLASSITIEAGGRYGAHYKAHGIVYKDGVTVAPLAQEFRAFLQRAGRPQATVALELGMSASALSRFLAGSTKTVSPGVRERMEVMLASEKQGLLPLS
jgi:hypothetical protein